MGTGSTSRNYPTRRCYLVILQHPQRTSRCLTGPRGRKFIRPLQEQTAMKGAGTRAVMTGELVGWEAMTVKVRCSLEWRGGGLAEQDRPRRWVSTSVLGTPEVTWGRNPGSQRRMGSLVNVTSTTRFLALLKLYRYLESVDALVMTIRPRTVTSMMALANGKTYRGTTPCAPERLL